MNNQTIVCSRISEDRFKLIVFNGMNHEEIYKNKNEMISIINYLKATLDDNYNIWDIRNATEKEIQKYNDL